MTERQTTAQSVCWRGVGVHTGEACAVRVHPGSSGLRLVLGESAIPLNEADTLDVARCTGLRVGSRTVLTVEHLLSALNGLGITDAEIEPDGPEIPILDGSAQPFAETLRDVGITTVSLDSPQGVPTIEVRVGDSWVRVERGSGHVSASVAYEHPAIGSQSFSLQLTPDAYLRELAPARTFGFLEDARRLREIGLALGASLDNTLVFSADGPMTTPRFRDEPVRHKLVDLIGDLALSGYSIYSLAVRAERPGHAVNVEVANRLRKGKSRREDGS